MLVSSPEPFDSGVFVCSDLSWYRTKRMIGKETKAQVGNL
jgi:hypothetical protein